MQFGSRPGTAPSSSGILEFNFQSGGWQESQLLEPSFDFRPRSSAAAAEIDESVDGGESVVELKLTIAVRDRALEEERKKVARLLKELDRMRASGGGSIGGFSNVSDLSK